MKLKEKQFNIILDIQKALTENRELKGRLLAEFSKVIRLLQTSISSEGNFILNSCK